MLRYLFSNECNLGQKGGDKFIKLCKIGFSMECLTADFLQFFTKNRQNLVLGWANGNSPSNPSILGDFLKFAIRRAIRTFTFW